MKKNLFAGLAILAIALSGTAYAATAIFINEEDLEYRGSWTWNSNGSSRVTVRVANTDAEATPDYDRVQVVVKARATDGSTVQGTKTALILGGQTRDFNFSFSKPLTSLQFVQILELPVNGDDD
jgi:hypothetical protein